LCFEQQQPKKKQGQVYRDERGQKDDVPLAREPLPRPQALIDVARRHQHSHEAAQGRHHTDKDVEWRRSVHGRRAVGKCGCHVTFLDVHGRPSFSGSGGIVLGRGAF